jgi:hypothetical protein
LTKEEMMPSYVAGFRVALGFLLVGAPLLSGCQDLFGWRTKDDPDNCVANPTICLPGQQCNMQTEVCQGSPQKPLDMSLLLGSPPSYILPGGSATTLTYPVDTNYVLAAEGAATIYYTLDGSVPTPGASGTTAAPSPVPLGVVPGGTQIQWYADYGPGYQPDPPRSFTALTNSTPPMNYGFIPQPALFSLNGANVGPVVVVAPGTPLSGTVSYQAWQSQPTGYCPGCIIQYVAAVPSLGAVGCNNTVSFSGPYPGMSSTLSFTFNAPMAPGRYALSTGFTLEFSCDGSVGGGPDVGEVIVQ